MFQHYNACTTYIPTRFFPDGMKCSIAVNTKLGEENFVLIRIRGLCNPPERTVSNFGASKSVNSPF